MERPEIWSIDICQKCHGNSLGKEKYFQQIAQNKPNVSKKNKYYTLSQKVYFALHYASLKNKKASHRLVQNICKMYIRQRPCN